MRRYILREGTAFVPNVLLPAKTSVHTVYECILPWTRVSARKHIFFSIERFIFSFSLHGSNAARHSAGTECNDHPTHIYGHTSTVPLGGTCCLCILTFFLVGVSLHLYRHTGTDGKRKPSSCSCILLGQDPLCLHMEATSFFLWQAHKHRSLTGDLSLQKKPFFNRDCDDSQEGTRVKGSWRQLTTAETVATAIQKKKVCSFHFFPIPTHVFPPSPLTHAHA